MQLSGISQKLSLIGKKSNTEPASNDILTEVGESFEDILQSLTQSQNKSDDLMGRLAAGEDVEIHDALITMTENSTNFRIAMEIRNKLVDAYREVMRISV